MFLQEQDSLSKRVSPGTTSLKACFSRNSILSQSMFLQEQHSLKPYFSRNNLSQSMFLREQPLSKHVSPGTTLSLKACFSRNTTLSLSKHVSPGTPLSLKACFSRNTTLSQSVFLQEQPLSKHVSSGTTHSHVSPTGKKKKKKKKKKGSTVKLGFLIFFYFFCKI